MVPEKQGKRLALLVGVNHAPQSTKAPLRYASQDSQDMAAIFQSPCCRFDSVTLLHNDAAKTMAVRQKIVELIRDKGDEDSLLFYFTGHGIQIALPDGNREVFLVTSDFDYEHAKVDPTSYISLSWLRDMFYYVTQAGHVVVMLDSCFSGFMIQNPLDSSFEQSLDFAQIRTILSECFDLRGAKLRPHVNGLRRVFAAAGPDKEASEGDGHSVMTGFILSALQGKETQAMNDAGEVTLPRLYTFLQEQMRKSGVPLLDYQGTDFDRTCVLAYHDPPAIQVARQRPARNYYIPRPLSSIFQERPDEFAEMLRRLDSSPRKPLGLVGMSGIGKSQLAAQFANHHQERFKDGIFWVEATGQTVEDWQRSFAKLARALSYRPTNSPDDEESLASHIAFYLAISSEALLILDGVEDPRLVTKLTHILAGQPLQCAILYTSISPQWTEDVTIYTVPRLSQEQAYRLLLPEQRSTILTALQKGIINAETHAASLICDYLGNHPLALEILRALLRDEPDLSLPDLETELSSRGILKLTQESQDNSRNERTLLETIQLVWQRVKNPDAERLFKLLSIYQDNTAIPLWLVGLASGLGESDTPFSPLHKAWQRLYHLSLVAYLTDQHLLQLHPMLREFGKLLISEDSENQKRLQEAGNRLTTALEDLSLLENRARQDYWTCLDQLRAAISYIQVLTDSFPRHLARIERYLDQESHLLASKDFWPERFPALFHQQIHNRLIEDPLRPGWRIKEGVTSDPWLNLLKRVGVRRRISEPRTFPSHDKEITAVAFSPDGREILTGSEDATARLLDTNSGRTLAILAEHKEGITSVAFSPNGKYLLTGSHDTTACFWRWDRSFYIMHYLCSFPHPEEVTSVSFSPDTHYILTGSHDNITRIWDLETRQVERELSGHVRPVSSAAFSSDGKLILTGSWDNTARLWDYTTGRELKAFALERVYDWDKIYSPKNSPEFYLKNVLTGERVTDLGILGMKEEDVRIITSVAFSPNSTHILVGSNDGTARLWEIASGHIIRTFSGHSDAVASIVFSADGTYILTGSGDGNVRLWEATTGNLLAIFNASARVTSVAFSPDGDKVLGGSNDHRARLWRVPPQMTTSIQASTSAPVSPVTRVALAYGGENKLYALTGYENGRIRFWNWSAAQKQLQPVISSSEHTRMITSLAFSQDRRKLLTGSEDGIAIRWEFSHGGLKPTHHVYHASPVSCALFSPDHDTLLTASLDGNVRLWTARSEKVPHTTITHSTPENKLVSCGTFSHDGDLVLVGMNEGWLALWSAKRKTREQIWRGHRSEITSVAFFPGDRFLLTSALEGKTCLWNVETSELLDELKEQREEVSLFAFSPNGRHLLACNRRGGQAQLWTVDMTGPIPVCTLRGIYRTYHRIGDACWLNDGQFILADTGGADGHPYFYQLQIENLV